MPLGIAQMSALASASGLMVFVSFLCCRTTIKSSFISRDYENLRIGGKQYEFMCCSYSDEQRGMLLNESGAVKVGGCLGKISNEEKLYVRTLQNINPDDYLAVTGPGGTVDLFRRIK